MKKLLSAFLLAGIAVAGFSTTANAQLYRDYCQWPFYSPYAGENPFLRSSAIMRTPDGTLVRSSLRYPAGGSGSPYYMNYAPRLEIRDARPLINVELF